MVHFIDYATDVFSLLDASCAKIRQTVRKVEVTDSGVAFGAVETCRTTYPRTRSLAAAAFAGSGGRRLCRSGNPVRSIDAFVDGD
jgi:hypothetical protein